MLLASWVDLEHKHVRSEAVQLIAVAADVKHGRAHVGSWLTRLSMSLAVPVGVLGVVEAPALLPEL